MDNFHIYSAFERCRCGAGLVYERGSSHLNGYWQCIVVASNQQWTPDHTPRIYFRDRTIVDELSVAAQGATTRYAPEPKMSIYLESGVEEAKATPAPPPPEPQQQVATGMALS